MLERLLDMSYAEVIQQLIFDTLGMTHSYYLSPEPIIPSRASGYTHTEQGYQHARFITAAAKYAAGGLGSTLEDLLLWDAALREERLLDRITQDRMYTPVQQHMSDRCLPKRGTASSSLLSQRPLLKTIAHSH
jgi:CubicO group peptidase (beta-lactamase class C family)